MRMIKLLIAINMLLLSLLSYTAYKSWQFSAHNNYHRNRMLEYQYMQRTLNEAQYNINFLIAKWGVALECNDGMCIILSEEILKDTYFAKTDYYFGKHTFMGYRILYNDNHVIKWSLYKP